ncbi:DEKNAAC101387 [Brettanomyces naardenensis]|uniref:DEKNAAC101387 n=1 Tax=Brettanomyces naardenensis TaxID=13370 RepID=A0A448YI13_BRENA|nr:DEKNAAC101387 [Brettanomyces naardenensis]
MDPDRLPLTVDKVDTQVRSEEIELPVDAQPATYPERGLKAYSVVLACWLGFICDFGLLNSIGAIESYAAEHILVNNTSTEISWIFSIYCFLTFGGNIISGFVFDKYGTKILSVVGSILIVGGLFATANCVTLWQFVMAFGICCGTGCALLMSPGVNSIGHFFNKRRGLAMGIAMSGASIGGVAWPLVCRSLYGKIGFAWTIRVLAFIFAALLSAMCFLIDDRRREFALKDVEKSDEQRSTSPLKDIIDFGMLKNVSYDLLVAALFLNEFSLVLTFTYVPSYALNQGFTQSISLIALTVLNGAGIPGRYLPSHLSDRVGDFNMICITSLGMTISIFIIWVPFGKHLGAFMAFNVMYGFFCAGTLALTPLCTSAVSEPKNYGKAYGTAYFFAAFGNLICLPIGMAITSTKGGYQAMAAFCGATCALATIFFTIARVKFGGFKMVSI